jgi:FkbM family methyltransferase
MIIDKISAWLPKEVSLLFIETITDFFFFFKRPQLSKFYSQFIRPGDLVFDVGAYEGHLAFVFLQLKAQVVCIDSNPACISILKKRFSTSKNITILWCGLGEKRETKDFYVSVYRPGTSTFSKKWQTSQFSTQNVYKKMKVPMKTLDEFMKRFGVPSFCKIDVEGFEFQVLSGLKKKHRGKVIQTISFEFTKQFFGDAEACANHLLHLGYRRFNVSLYSNFSLEFNSWMTWNELRRKLLQLQRSDLHGDIFAKP